LQKCHLPSSAVHPYLYPNQSLWSQLLTEHSNTGMHDGHKHTYVHTETHIRAHGHTPMVLSVVDMELSRLSMELLCVACRLEMLLPRALDDITALGSCLEETE